MEEGVIEVSLTYYLQYITTIKKKHICIMGCPVVQLLALLPQSYKTNVDPRFGKSLVLQCGVCMFSLCMR